MPTNSNRFRCWPWQHCQELNHPDLVSVKKLRSEWVGSRHFLAAGATANLQPFFRYVPSNHTLEYTVYGPALPSCHVTALSNYLSSCPLRLAVHRLPGVLAIGYAKRGGECHIRCVIQSSIPKPYVVLSNRHSVNKPRALLPNCVTQLEDGKLVTNDYAQLVLAYSVRKRHHWDQFSKVILV
jgi:hypothetical protein